MTRHPRPLSFALLVVAIVVVAAWAAASVAPAAHAATARHAEATARATIPQKSTAVFKWTFEVGPAQAVAARFQISKDKVHWNTLAKITVKAGQKIVHTRWQAPSRAEVRFFRLRTSTVRSDVVRVRVR